MSDKRLVKSIQETEKGVLIDSVSIEFSDIGANERAEACTAE
jgi:hypothetical protein